MEHNMPIQITSDLPSSLLRQKTQSQRSIKDLDDKTKALKAFLSSPTDIDLSEFGYSLATLTQVAIHTKSQASYHKALVVRISNQYVDADGKIQLPTIMTVDVNLQEVEVLDMGRKSIRALVSICRNMGKSGNQMMITKSSRSSQKKAK